MVLLLLWDCDPTTCVQTNVWYIRHWGLTGCILPAFSSVGGSLQEHTTTDWPSGWTWATWGSSTKLLFLEYMLCPPCPWWESFQVYSLERVRCWDYLDAWTQLRTLHKLKILLRSAEIDSSSYLTLQAFSVPLLIKPSTSFFVLSLPSMCRNQFHILFTIFLFFGMNNWWTILRIIWI